MNYEHEKNISTMIRTENKRISGENYKEQV